MQNAAHKNRGLAILGVLCILAGLVLIPKSVLTAFVSTAAITSGQLTSEDAVTIALCVIIVIFNIAMPLCLLIFGITLIRKKRKNARKVALVLIVALILNALALMMLYGMEVDLLFYLASALVLIALLTYIDPDLAAERTQAHLERQTELKREVDAGTLGRDESGAGFIKLDFFNLFWIFVIACILGDLVETVYHVAVVDPGHYQVRAGLLWGPFSPIYGFGALLMTLALNRFHKAHLIVVFLVSAVIGGAFEYCVSWFLQFAFGVTAWDYSGTFLNIGGRTNLMFMCMWGVLGVLWIKAFLPLVLKVVNLIPWKWRYTITAIAAALMFFDGAMTLVTLDCWFERVADVAPDSWLAQFCAQYFDNSWMAHRFQSMSIDPSISTRL